MDQPSKTKRARDGNIAKKYIFSYIKRRNLVKKKYEVPMELTSFIFMVKEYVMEERNTME
jgi:hypothetical protein